MCQLHHKKQPLNWFLTEIFNTQEQKTLINSVGQSVVFIECQKELNCFCMYGEGCLCHWSRIHTSILFIYNETRKKEKSFQSVNKTGFMWKWFFKWADSCDVQSRGGEGDMTALTGDQMKRTISLNEITDFSGLKHCWKPEVDRLIGANKTFYKGCAESKSWLLTWNYWLSRKIIAQKIKITPTSSKFI